MFAMGVLATGSCVLLASLVFSTVAQTDLPRARARRSLGGVMYPSMLQKLIRTVGWGWAIRAVGFINLGLIAFASVTVKTRLPPRPAGKFVDFGVFVGKVNVGYTLYVAGAATVWLGASSSLLVPRASDEARARKVFPDELARADSLLVQVSTRPCSTRSSTRWPTT